MKNLPFPNASFHRTLRGRGFILRLGYDVRFEFADGVLKLWDQQMSMTVREGFKNWLEAKAYAVTLARFIANAMEDKE